MYEFSQCVKKLQQVYEIFISPQTLQIVCLWKNNENTQFCSGTETHIFSPLKMCLELHVHVAVSVGLWCRA